MATFDPAWSWKVSSDGVVIGGRTTGGVVVEVPPDSSSKMIDADCDLPVHLDLYRDLYSACP